MGEHLTFPRVFKLMLSKIDDLPFVNKRNAFYLLLAMHVAGIVGLSIDSTRALFQSLTPINLFLTAAIVLHFEKEKNGNYIIFILATLLIGFFVEVAGVHTGVIFGNYSYGATLGPKLWDVPLAIGLNWVIMIYTTGLFAREVTQNKLHTIIVGALLMTVIDMLIEPVAIKLDFWSWESTSIPLRNYLGWFLTSLGLHGLFYFLMPKANNSLAIRLLYVLIGFFLVLNFI